MSVQIAAGASFWFCISGFTANELKGRNGPWACCVVRSSIDGGPSTWSHQCPTLGPSVLTRPTQISIRLLLFYETQTGRTLHQCWPTLPPMCLWQTMWEFTAPQIWEKHKMYKLAQQQILKHTITTTNYLTFFLLISDILKYFITPLHRQIQLKHSL